MAKAKRVKAAAVKDAAAEVTAVANARWPAKPAPPLLADQDGRCVVCHAEPGEKHTIGDNGQRCPHRGLMEE